MIDRAANVLMRGAGKIEAVHQMTGLVRFLRDATLEQIGRQRVEPGRRKTIGNAADLLVEPPPFLDHYHTGSALPCIGQIAAADAAIRPLVFDHLSHG